MLDLIAQLIILSGIVLAVTPEGRSLLKDLEDGNVERLEREERRYQEALWWLSNMEERIDR